MRWLEPRECYWALADAPPPGDCNGPAARLVLDELFERDVPEPFESLVVRYTRAGDAVLACGVPIERVRDALDRGAVVLRPRALPATVHEQLPAGSNADDIARALNFLVGDFEPLAASRLRLGRRRLMLGGLAASLLVVAGGLHLATAANEQQAARAEHATMATLMAAAPSQTSNLTATDLTMQLRRELAQIGRTRGDEALRARLRDASDGLAAVLGAWPSDLEARVGALQVNPNQIVLSVDLPKTGDAELLTAALKAVPGWSLLPPRTEIAGGVAKVNAVLRPVPTSVAPGQPSSLSMKESGS